MCFDTGAEFANLCCHLLAGSAHNCAWLQLCSNVQSCISPASNDSPLQSGETVSAGFVQLSSAPFCLSQISDCGDHRRFHSRLHFQVLLRGAANRTLKPAVRAFLTRHVNDTKGTEFEKESHTKTWVSRRLLLKKVGTTLRLRWFALSAVLSGWHGIFVP